MSHVYTIQYYKSLAVQMIFVMPVKSLNTKKKKKHEKEAGQTQ